MEGKLQIAKAKVQAAWAKFKGVADWYQANSPYFTILGRILLSKPVLGLLIAFGVTAPDTANKIKQEVLGESLAQDVEVLDNVNIAGTE